MKQPAGEWTSLGLRRCCFRDRKHALETDPGARVGVYFKSLGGILDLPPLSLGHKHVFEGKAAGVKIYLEYKGLKVCKGRDGTKRKKQQQSSDSRKRQGGGAGGKQDSGSEDEQEQEVSSEEEDEGGGSKAEEREQEGGSKAALLAAAAAAAAMGKQSLDPQAPPAFLGTIDQMKKASLSCLSTRLPACLPFYTPACLPAFLRSCLPACLHTCLPACLHTCLPASAWYAYAGI